MAETSVLSFSTFSTIPSVFRSGESCFSPSTSFSRFPISRSPHPRLLRFTIKSSDSGSFFGEDSLGFFPWSDGNDDIQWVQEERFTLFTADGLIQIGGSMVPRRFVSSNQTTPPLCFSILNEEGRRNVVLSTFVNEAVISFKNYFKKQGITKNSKKRQRFQECDYMDPNQELCLGALFDIAATNGLDLGRKLCIFGFCRSIEMLSDVVEGTVLDNGGEVVVAEKASKGGLHERLTMTVAVPYLWGVPPVSETLHLAVRSGGGIVEKRKSRFLMGVQANEEVLGFYLASDFWFTNWYKSFSCIIVEHWCPGRNEYLQSEMQNGQCSDLLEHPAILAGGEAMQ